MEHTVILERRMSRRTNDETLESQIQWIVGQAFNGRADWRSWTSRWEQLTAEYFQGTWIFQYKIFVSKNRQNSPRELTEWEEIKEGFRVAGQATRFSTTNTPWTIVNAMTSSDDGTVVITGEPEPPKDIISDFKSDIRDIFNKVTGVSAIREILPIGKAKTWEELCVPPELIGPDSDRHLAQHDAWKDLYGVNAQIRILLSNIKRAQQTNGESRNHAVLFGKPGCGKTTTMRAIEKMFGSESVLKLDATSTTKAGLEKMFFTRDKDGNLPAIPPIVIMEEAEKTDPEALKIWLGALDDRGEIRKINFKVNQLREVKVLFICSVNNKTTFDRMMGTGGLDAGALSSRCVTQVYFPRPSESILEQILAKEIVTNGGNPVWIPHAIKMAKDLGVTDPRIVRSYLAGGERLVDGSYQRDWLAVQESQKEFNLD